MSKTQASNCWKATKLAVGESKNISIGPLSIYLKREKYQWLLAHERTNSTDDAYHVNDIEMPLELTADRFIFEKSPEQFILTPLLLNKPVVVKTLQPVHIPPNVTTTLYISSPICVNISLLSPNHQLQEIMTQRLSDTWFGPSTQEGEFCFADTTHARYNKDDLPKRSFKAITPVTIHNATKELLTLKKISIPVPFLNIYSADDGHLWTDPITLERETPGSLARLKIGHLTNKEAKGATLLNEARHPSAKLSLIRVFTHIFAE